jgi:hypothetical protein
LAVWIRRHKGIIGADETVSATAAVVPFTAGGKSACQRAPWHASFMTVVTDLLVYMEKGECRCIRNLTVATF